MEWRETNGEHCEVPEQVKGGDWVQFLHDTFPPEKLSEMPGSTPEKTALRVQYLREIYKVAGQEQLMRISGNGNYKFL